MRELDAFTNPGWLGPPADASVAAAQPIVDLGWIPATGNGAPFSQAGPGAAEPSAAAVLADALSLGGSGSSDSSFAMQQQVQPALTGLDSMWDGSFDMPVLPPAMDPALSLGGFDFRLDAAAASAGGGAAASFPGPAPSFGAAQTAAAAGPSTSRMENERQERLRAQNRAKQARFRAKRKEQKEDMQQRFEATAADLERERSANAAMQLSVQLLEGMKEHKDMAVGVLEAAAGHARQEQGAQPPLVQQAVALPSDTTLSGTTAGSSGCTGGGSSGGNTAGCAGGSSGCAGSSGGGSGELAQRIQALPFLERVDLCCSIFNATEPAKQTLIQQAGCGGEKGVDGFALGVEVRRALGAHMVEAQPQLLEAVMSFTPENILKDWADFGEFAAGIVQQVDDGQLSEAEAEKSLEPAVMYQAILHMLLLHHKPEVEHALLQHTKLPGETEEQAKARWRQVFFAMNVSEEKGREILPHYQTYCSRMQQLGQEAATCLATLQEVQQSLSAHLDMLGSSSLSSMVHQYLQVFEAADKLKQQPTASMLLLKEFFGAAGRVTLPLQKARMTAACRPLHPDVVAIVREGLRHHGLLPDEEGGQA